MGFFVRRNPPGDELTDAAHLLWATPDIDSRRAARSAAALVAVQRVLRDDPALPGATAFLALYDIVAAADPQHFTRVWRDPAAYHWVRRAVHLLSVWNGEALPAWEQTYCDALGAAGAAQALPLHLAQFGKFALATALIAGTDLRLPAAYATAPPLALSGTELALVGRGRVVVHGVESGGLDVSHDGTRRRLAPQQTAAGQAARLDVCPTVQIGGARVVLNPYVFHLPGLSLFSELSGAGVEFQARYQGAVADALAALQRFQPATFAQFADAIRIVALKPAREEDFGTLSTSELPGAFVCSVPADPLALAADFIHELHHGRLFSIEEDGPFFDASGEDAVEGEHHYSPWRDAPRPLHGLLHALYVYLPVFRFWSAAWRACELDGMRRDFARDQLARIPFQLRIAVQQLRRHAHFTPFGSSLFEQMACEADAIKAEAATLGATLATGAVACRASGAFRPIERSGRQLTVAENLLDHLRRCDRGNECAEERDLLAQSAGAS